MEIVGLKNFVQDDVNKLIAKFVGFESKVAKEIKEQKRSLEGELDVVFIRLLRWRCGGYKLRILIEGVMIPKPLTIKQCREQFVKFPAWKRKLYIMTRWREVFPRRAWNNKNLKFLNEQIHELGFKNSIPTWDFEGKLIW